MAWEHKNNNNNNNNARSQRPEENTTLGSKENHNQRPKQKARPRRQGKATNRKLKTEKKDTEEQTNTKDKTKTERANLQWNAVGQLFYKTPPQKIKLELELGWSGVERSVMVVGAAFRVF